MLYLYLLSLVAAQCQTICPVTDFVTITVFKTQRVQTVLFTSTSFTTIEETSVATVISSTIETLTSTLSVSETLSSSSSPTTDLTSDPPFFFFGNQTVTSSESSSSSQTSSCVETGYGKPADPCATPSFPIPSTFLTAPTSDSSSTLDPLPTE